MKPFFFVFALLVMPALAHAADGSESGGGGDVVILPDDTVVLADIFLDHNSPQPSNMPPMRALNPRILQLVKSYTSVIAPVLQELGPGRGASAILNLLTELSIRNNDLRFYGVRDAQELNTFCASGGRKVYTLPDGTQVQQVACTAGREVFLVEPLFIRLSLRDQVLLLMHERLTTLRDAHGGRNYSAIARFTSGLGTLITLYQEQQRSNRRRLSTAEVDRLTNFYFAIQEIELRDSEVSETAFQWMIHPYGGGRFHETARISQGAFVSVSSKVGVRSTLGERSKVSYSTIGDHVFIDDEADVSNSTINCRSACSLGPKARLESSTVDVNSLQAGRNLTLLRSIVAGRVIRSISVAPWDLLRDILGTRQSAGGDFSIGDNQSLVSGVLGADVQENYLPLTRRVRPIRINATKAPREWQIPLNGIDERLFLTNTLPIERTINARPSLQTNFVAEEANSRFEWTIRTESKKVTSGVFNRTETFYTILRQVDTSIELGLNLPVAPDNSYLLVNGAIAKAGTVKAIRFSTKQFGYGSTPIYHTAHKFMSEVLENGLIQQGIQYRKTAEAYGAYTYSVVLPVVE